MQKKVTAMPNLKKSSVWHHYTEYTDGRKIVGKCKYCGQTYANNATRMKRHLATLCQRCPERVQDSFKRLLEKSDCSLPMKYLHHTSYEAGSSSQAAAFPIVETVNVPLLYLDEGPFSASGSQDVSCKVDRSTSVGSGTSFVGAVSEVDQDKEGVGFVEVMSLRNTPLSISENEDCKQPYKLMCPSYALSSSSQVTHSVIGGQYSGIPATIAQKIHQAEYLTLMSDGWTDEQENSLLNIRFATPEPIYLKTVVTKSSEQTGDYIANLLSEEIERADPFRVQALVTNHANNMHSAWEILKSKYPHLIVFGCLTSGLNSLANSIVHLRSIKTIISDCNEIANVFNNHRLISYTLNRIQKEEQGTEGKLIYEATKCLESLLNSKSRLQYSAVDEKVSQVIPVNICKKILDGNVFWVQVQGVFNLLFPILEAVMKLEEGTPNISSIPDIFRKLNENVMENLPSLTLPKADKDEAKQIFENSCKFCCHPIHLAANLLDPRHGGDNLSEEEFCIALDAIVDVAKNLSSIDEMRVVTDLAEYRAKDKLWSREIIWRAAKTMSPLTWWKGFFKSRQLSRIAVRILTIPSTARSNEQA
ncbi:uncharacterized protein LOC134607758 [Pelobates fuscus]|uniref:uncharacterized protein LOC134607758 n=1 Tax=Pelobates fuscus TaxID=191477 RepID=UPI002FE46E1D